ncbi:MAG: PPC domain-containing protein, partial [Myxococcales bacterium]|nr:PPC domain-containing protein [Myxococcales bacterium]
EVTVATGDCINYTLNYTLVEPPPCLPDAYEPNDTRDTATFVLPPQDLTVESTNAEDYLDFEVAAGATVTVTVLFTHAEGDIDLYVYPDVGSPVGVSTSSSDNESVTLTNNDAVPATYTARVWLRNPGTSLPCMTYRLEVL